MHECDRGCTDPIGTAWKILAYPSVLFYIVCKSSFLLMKVRREEDAGGVLFSRLAAESPSRKRTKL